MYNIMLMLANNFKIVYFGTINSKNKELYE